MPTASALPRPVPVALLAPLPAELLTAQVEGITVRTAEEHGRAAAEGAAIVVAGWSPAVKVDAAMVEVLAPTCRLVQVPAAGTDSVDVQACRDAGIPVASCAGLNSVAVAEWCVWAILDALRQFSAAAGNLRAGTWEQLGRARYELQGRTVGIVGLGAIGIEVVQRLQPFGVDLRYTSGRRRDAETEARLGVRWQELDDLVADVDVLLLACALTDDTRGLLSRDRIARMRPTAVVVNAARGEVTDETALAAALVEGRLHGAAIDAFSTEPLPDDHPLLAASTAALTPHVAGASAESVIAILGRVVANVRAVVDGDDVVGIL